MRYFIIDGFNVLHKLPDRTTKNDPTHRDLINFIKHHKLTGNKNNKVMIVFDGPVNYDCIGEREFEIRFSLEKKADELIQSRISSYANKRQLVVVSNDREIVNFCKKTGAQPLSVEDFIHRSKKAGSKEEEKSISYTDQRQITDELKKIWLKE